MGTWKITAHYEGDEANAASRDFKVQKFGKLIWLKCFTAFFFNYETIILPSKNTFIVTHPSFTQFWGEHRNEAQLYFVECWTVWFHHLSQVSVDSFPIKLHFAQLKPH